MNSIQYHQKSSKTVLLLPVIILFLFYTSTQPYTDQVSATQKALIFAMIFAILVSCMYLPDGLILRPSKYIWKAITGLSFFYLSILIYFIYLDKGTTISIIHTYFDRGLQNFNYEEESYGADCRIYAHEKENSFQNLHNTFFDIFAFAHAAGWLCKTMVIRDFKLVIFASVTFQILEYSLRNVLNNFKQCWWDHLLVDILGCNLLGIVVGFYLIDKFKLQRYRWSLRDAPFQTSIFSQIKYLLLNWDLSKLQTKSFSSLKKYLQLFWYLAFIQINDLTLFFLKYIYKIPPSNYMVICRIVIIGFLCVNASKQYYRFLIKRQRQIKINCFMVNMIVFTEILLIIKHGYGQFGHAYFTWDAYILMGSLCFLFIFLFFKILISDIINWKKDKTKSEGGLKTILKEQVKKSKKLK